MQIEFSRRIVQVKRTRILATVLLTAIPLLVSSCGTSDSIKSITLSANGTSSGGTFNMAGTDATVPLIVYANYHSGKQVVVTSDVTYSVTEQGLDQSGANLPPFGPGNVTISGTGLMTDIVPLCTWVDGSTAGKADNPPVWALTGYYQVTAIYRGMSSQPIAVGAGSAVSTTSPVGGCGPA